MTADLEARALELEHVWVHSIEDIGEHSTVDELAVTLAIAAGASRLGSKEESCYGFFLNAVLFAEEWFGGDDDAMKVWLAVQHFIRHLTSSHIDESPDDGEWP